MYVCKVETRSQAREREEEEEEEAEQELQDTPITHNLDDYLVQLSEKNFGEDNISEVEAGEEYGRDNLVLEEEEENICLGKRSACMLTVNKTDGSLTRSDMNLPVVEKGSDRDKLIKETAQDKSLEAWRKLAQRKEKNFKIDMVLLPR